MRSKIIKAEANTDKNVSENIAVQDTPGVIDDKKSNGENLHIPVCAILAESEKSILFKAGNYSFWLAKKFVKINDLNDFCHKVNIYIVLNWDYTDTMGNTITGIKLARAVKLAYKDYQTPIK